MSSVWKFFDKIKENELIFTKCKICNSKLTFSSNSTGAMLNHLRLKHPIELKANDSNAVAGSSQTSIKTYFRDNKPCSAEKSNKISETIAKFFYKDLLPLKLAESPNLRELMKYLEPNYALPSRKNFTSKLEQLYTSEKENLRIQLTGDQCGTVSLTTDCWTSLNADSFITITAHFVNKSNWNMESIVLATSFIEVTHTAENLRSIIENILDEFGIQGKLFACIHDNAANIKLAMKNSTIIKHTVCCAAHILQLSVNSGLKIANVQKVIAAASK